MRHSLHLRRNSEVNNLWIRWRRKPSPAWRDGRVVELDTGDWSLVINFFPPSPWSRISPSSPLLVCVWQCPKPSAVGSRAVMSDGNDIIMLKCLYQLRSSQENKPVKCSQQREFIPGNWLHQWWKDQETKIKSEENRDFDKSRKLPPPWGTEGRGRVTDPGDQGHPMESVPLEQKPPRKQLFPHKRESSNVASPPSSCPPISHQSLLLAKSSQTQFESRKCGLSLVIQNKAIEGRGMKHR